MRIKNCALASAVDFMGIIFSWRFDWPLGCLQTYVLRSHFAFPVNFCDRCVLLPNVCRFPFMPGRCILIVPHCMPLVHREVYISLLFVLTELDICIRAFILVHSVGGPSQIPSKAPFSVISCHDKTLEVDSLGLANALCIYCFKDAHIGDGQLPNIYRIDVYHPCPSDSRACNYLCLPLYRKRTWPHIHFLPNRPRTKLPPKFRYEGRSSGRYFPLWR